MMTIRPGQGSLMITEQLSMGPRSSFGTGGKAEYYTEPRTVDECLSALELAYKKGLPVTIIGSGTHILVSEEGIPGLVISSMGLRGITIKGDLLEAASGETLDNVINQAIDHNLIGLEEIAGIPGTIAGAISVNATANGKSISDMFFYADYLSVKGEVHRRPYYHDYFRSQKSAFKNGELITSIALRLKPSKASAEARVRKEEYVELMFIPPCRRFSGEIFRDPEEMSAADALRKAGMTGPSGVRAEFSEYQPNSIFTYPGCTSAEIYSLILRAEREVKEKLGIELERSITVLGSFSEKL